MDSIDSSGVPTRRPSADESHDGACLKSFFFKDDEAQIKDSLHEDRRVFLECRSQSEHSEFDVVFVHGLGRDRSDAWSCGDVFWPDYIVNDLPGSRVLLFNYDTRLWNQPSLSSIKNVANDLALVLGKARRGLPSERRIIWVAQSLGGFLVKAVFILSTQQPDIPQGNILHDSLEKSTNGAIFIGTPHRPLLVDRWQPMLQRVYEVASEHYPTTVSIYNPDAFNGVIEYLNRFYLLIDKYKMRIISFYEEYETSGTSLPTVITSSQNGFFHLRETRDTLSGNYLTMSQFQSRRDPGYTKLRDYLRTISCTPMNVDILTKSGPATLAPSSLEKSIVFAAKDVLALKFDGGRGTRHNNNLMMPQSTIWQFAPIFKPRRLKRSLAILGPYTTPSPTIHSQTTLDHPVWRLSTYESQFMHWYDSGSVLVIREPSGLAKSVFAYQIIQRLGTMERGENSTNDPRKCILSYFFGDALRFENVISQMLNQFLLQFLEIIPLLTRHFPTRRVFARAGSSCSEWDMEDTMEDDRGTEALPLNADPNSTESSSYLGYEDFVTNPFTIPELVEIFISILHDDQVGDVFLVIHGLDNFPDGVQSQFQGFLTIVESLQIKKVKVCLCCDKIQIQSSKQIIYVDAPLGEESILREIEKNDPFYESVFRDLEFLNRWEQIGYLFLIAAAARALTISEAYDFAPTAEKLAFEYSKKAKTIPRGGIDTAKWAHELETRSLGLLRIVDGTLTLSHPSLRGFLLRELGDLKHYADYYIGISCLKLMQSLADGLKGREYSVTIEKFSYPLQYWSKHLQAAHSSTDWNSKHSVETLDLLTPLWLNTETRSIMRAFLQVNLPPVTELPLACLLASCDLSKVLDIHYDDGDRQTISEDKYATIGKRCAVVNPGTDALKVLEKRNPVNHLNGQHGKSLEKYESWARSRQLAEQFFLLGWTFEPIDADITEERHWGVIRQMLKEPSKLKLLQSKDYLDQLLLLAIRRCDKEFAIELLENGANKDYVDLNDPRKPSVLHIAAALGDYGLAKELVHRTCRLSTTDAFGMEPIHWAAERGHYKIVELLISRSSRGDEWFGRNALFMVCESVSSRAVLAFLESSPDINPRDNRQRTPIHVAAAIGATEIVRLLLSKGANPKAQDEEGIAPLHLAAFGGWVGVVDELLSAGVSINTVTKTQWTPLHFACESPNPSLAVALTLLQQQCDPCPMDYEGLSPLHIAVRNGSVALVELLLKATSYRYDVTELLNLAGMNDEIRDILLEPRKYNDSLLQSRPKDSERADQMNQP